MTRLPAAELFFSVGLGEVGQIIDLVRLNSSLEAQATASDGKRRLEKTRPTRVPGETFPETEYECVSFLRLPLGCLGC